MRMNYSMIGCQKSVSFVTSQEMVVGLPHSEYRLWLQTASCCYEGNRLVVNDDWKRCRWALRGKLQGGERKWTFDEVSLAKSRSHQNQVTFLGLGWRQEKPVYWLSGVRYIGGTTLQQALERNVRSRHGMPRENDESADTQVRKYRCPCLRRTTP